MLVESALFVVVDVVFVVVVVPEWVNTQDKIDLFRFEHHWQQSYDTVVAFQIDVSLAKQH